MCRSQTKETSLKYKVFTLRAQKCQVFCASEFTKSFYDFTNKVSETERLGESVLQMSGIHQFKYTHSADQSP